MDTVFRSQVLSLDDTTIEALATAIFEEDSSDIKSQTVFKIKDLIFKK
jgi:hypothetical protein